VHSDDRRSEASIRGYLIDCNFLHISVFGVFFLFYPFSVIIMQQPKRQNEDTGELFKDIDAYIESVTKAK